MHGLRQVPITIRHHSLIVSLGSMGLLLAHGKCNIHADTLRSLITVKDKLSTNNAADTNSRHHRCTYYAKVGSRILCVYGLEHTIARLNF
jgi:hypothetical protein